MMLKQFLLVVFLFLTIFGIKSSVAVESDSSSTEWIKVYFNMPADYSVANPGNMSRSSADLIGTLETLIHSANHSIDLAIYDLEHPRIGRALAAAQKRGVRVRIVTDNYNRTDSGKIDSTMWATLHKAGITSIDDDGDVYEPEGEIIDFSLTNAGADMHHKFAVFDAQNSSPDDDMVWTGSTNLTYTGAYNTNNTIVIKDSGVAGAYLREFEQMWGSDEDEPNPLQAKFHKDKRPVSDHIYYVGNTKVELYFGPINRDDSKSSIMKRLVEVVRQEAQHDVVFQAFVITPSIDLSRTIWEMSATGEVKLQGIIDPLFYYRYRSSGDIWASAEAKSGNRLILPANEMRKLHHKIMLVDPTHPNPQDQAITIAGSYNFSKNAEVNNDENLLIIHSDSITNQYYQDFSGALRRAQGEGPIPAPPIESDRWYPIAEVSDGSEFAIEVQPGFEYGVEFLGVDMPRIYAGSDSSDYYSAEAAKYVRNLISGGEVKLQGAGSTDRPEARYGSFKAYVTLKKDGNIISLNKQLLQNGFGQYAPYYAQHPDSVAAFKAYAQSAKESGKAIWKNPEKIDTKYLRAEVIGEGAEPSEAFPININTADEALLDLLPGIGPVYAKRIMTYREENGQFTDVEQLRSIKGIGPKTMQKLRPNIVLEEP